MSRKEIVGENATIAFGVDHVTGAFVQLWTNPKEEQDCAFVIVDSAGIRVDDDDGTRLTVRVSDHLNRLEQRFKDFCASHPGKRPNITEEIVINLSQVVGGFPDISMEVYKIFGDDI